MQLERDGKTIKVTSEIKQKEIAKLRKPNSTTGNYFRDGKGRKNSVVLFAFRRKYNAEKPDPTETVFFYLRTPTSGIQNYPS